LPGFSNVDLNQAVNRPIQFGSIGFWAGAEAPATPVLIRDRNVEGFVNDGPVGNSREGRV
jgi:hypothetical protein